MGLFAKIAKKEYEHGGNPRGEQKATNSVPFKITFQSELFL